jgi:hypothetical protein
MTRHSNRNNSRSIGKGGRRVGRAWFSSAAGDGENKHASLRHRSLVSPRSSWRNNALLALLLLTSSSMLVNFQYVKDASRYLDNNTNNVKKMSHLPPVSTKQIRVLQRNIKVFFNVYASPSDVASKQRAKQYVDEQMTMLLPEHQVLFSP